ncbi:MAG: OmpA family protein [Gammaproteobacteria bacterium]|nr:OmpA family protein [Gammaproteobacteria bacterium]
MPGPKTEPRFRRQRIDTEDDGGDSWLLTYSDAVTLLMTFLVLMLSVSTIDQSKYEEVVESIKEKALETEKFKSPFETLKQDLDKVTEEHNLKDKMEVVRHPKGVTIELSSSSLYPVGSADIQASAASALRAVANSIKNFEYKDYQVEIEGHTDNVAINTLRYPSNWELSVHRATNIVRFLSFEGVDNKKMKAAGYADTRPKVPNLDEAGMPVAENQAKNRRIVIRVERKDG